MRRASGFLQIQKARRMPTRGDGLLFLTKNWADESGIFLHQGEQGVDKTNVKQKTSIAIIPENIIIFG